jgi:single-strand DNA-binding protein
MSLSAAAYRRRNQNPFHAHGMEGKREARKINHLNSIIIEGNIANDPVLKETCNKMVCNFVIASDRFFKRDFLTEKEAGFFDVEVWGKMAETVGNHGYKGRGVRVTGHLKQDRWTGKDGKIKSKVVIAAENVELRNEKPAGKKEESVEENVGAE